MRLSGSRYHLALLCQYPFRPDVEVPEGPQSAAAALGTEAHAFLEASLKGDDPKALMLQPDAARIGAQARFWVDEVGVPRAVEVAIAYDAGTDTSRQLHTTGHREYGPLGPMEIPTTLDLVWTDTEHVIVRDLKTGKREHAHPEQLSIQALAASRLYGKRRARVGFLFARKTKCDADPLEELSDAHLEAESYRAAAVMRLAPNAKPQPGKHCWFCPARTVCPEQSGYVAPDAPKGSE